MLTLLELQGGDVVAAAGRVSDRVTSSTGAEGEVQTFLSLRRAHRTG